VWWSVPRQAPRYVVLGISLVATLATLLGGCAAHAPVQPGPVRTVLRPAPLSTVALPAPPSDLGLAPVNVPITFADEGRAIRLSQYRVGDSDVYVADVRVANAGILRSGLARDNGNANTFVPTSSLAAAHGAVLAINGDSYAARKAGYAIRNGTVLRSVAASNARQDVAVERDGTLRVIAESKTRTSVLARNGVRDVLSFGPALVNAGSVVVAATDTQNHADLPEPRTAIAQVGPLHYLFVVVDGRTLASAGMTCPDLARFLLAYGAVTAYNLDGGGSSTLWFDGAVVNSPTTDGVVIQERGVSDIVLV